jgi:hypothetical protein
MQSKHAPSPTHQERTVRILPKKEDHITTYANNVQIFVTAWDATFVFGQLESVSETEQEVQPKISVIMSPQHTKAFVGALATLVKRYEDDFGEIHIEPMQSSTKPGKQ